MAKVTKAQGKSFTEEEVNDPDPPVTVQRAMLGELKEEVETEWVGTNYFQPSVSESPSSEPSKHLPPPLVQTTENPSNPPEEASSDADSTDGNGQTTEPTQSDKKATNPAKATGKKAAPAKATKAQGARATVMNGAEEDPDFDEFS